MSVMKAKTSLTLSADLVASIDKPAGPKVSRSAYIEQILRGFIERCAQARKDVRETLSINRHSAQLNAEMADALSFQASLADENPGYSDGGDGRVQEHQDSL